MSSTTARVAASASSTSSARDARARHRRARRAVARRASSSASSSSSTSPSAETTLLSLIETGASDDAVSRAIGDLVDSFDVSQRYDAVDALETVLEGTWRLVYSTKSKFDAAAPLGRRTDATTPGLEALFSILFDGPEKKRASTGGGGSGVEASSSPIQRAVLQKLNDGGFAVRQGVALKNGRGRVDQAVCFGRGGWFRLSANATLESPRATDARARGRINYGFDLAYLDVKSPFEVRLPYPVPFKLLGKEAMGYLTCDYVSDDVRVSTGNKGTTFVFVKEEKNALPYANELYGGEL